MPFCCTMLSVLSRAPSSCVLSGEKNKQTTKHEIYRQLTWGQIPFSAFRDWLIDCDWHGEFGRGRAQLLPTHETKKDFTLERDMIWMMGWVSLLSDSKAACLSLLSSLSRGVSLFLPVACCSASILRGRVKLSGVLPMQSHSDDCHCHS